MKGVGFLLFWIILGQGLKLGPINIFDELALLIIILNLIKKKEFLIKFNIQAIFGFYFFIMNIVGFLLYSEISALRLSFTGLLILFSSNIKLNLVSFKKHNILLIYPILIVLINLFEIVNFGRIIRYSHQDWFWSGTAYSSFGTIICFSLYSLFNRTSFKNILFHFILCSMAGILTDSRTTILLISLNYFFYLLYYFIIDYKIKIYNKFKFLFYGLLIFLVSNFIIKSIADDEIFGQFSSAINVGNAIIKNKVQENSESDQGRQDQTIIAFESMLNGNIFNLFFGYGGEAHKTYLLKFLDGDKLSGGDKIRPVGIAGIIIDGGLLYILFLFFIILNSITQVFKNIILNDADIFNSFLVVFLLFVSIFILFITNTADSILFYFILFYNVLPKEIQLYSIKKKY